MSKSSSAKRGKFWRTDWFVGVLVVVGVLILHQATDIIGTLERRFYDYSSTQSSRQPSDRIAVIAIDDQSIANIGRRRRPRPSNPPRASCYRPRCPAAGGVAVHSEAKRPAA